MTNEELKSARLTSIALHGSKSTIGRYNSMRTRSLFLETNLNPEETGYAPIYTLSEEEKEGLPSAYQIFMDSVDEYDFAMRLVGSMRHFRKLLNSKWFMEGCTGHSGFESWREDKKQRERSKNKQRLEALAEQGNVQAIKELQRVWEKENGTRTVGRPKKEKEQIPEDDSVTDFEKYLEERKKAKGE